MAYVTAVNLRMTDDGRISVTVPWGGTYTGSLETFERLTWDTAVAAWDRVWEGMAGRDQAWERIANLPESVAHLIVRIMAAEFIGPEVAPIR